MDIKGYRVLQQWELDLVARIKEQEECLVTMIGDLRTWGATEELLGEATSQLRTGMMLAVRAITKPVGGL